MRAKLTLLVICLDRYSEIMHWKYEDYVFASDVMLGESQEGKSWIYTDPRQGH